MKVKTHLWLLPMCSLVIWCYHLPVMESFLEYTKRRESRLENKHRFAKFKGSFWYTHPDVPCSASQPHITSNHPCRSRISSVCSAVTSFFYSSATNGCRSNSGQGMKLYFPPSGYCQGEKSMSKMANPGHYLLYLISDPLLHKDWESCKHGFPDFWVLQL